MRTTFYLLVSMLVLTSCGKLSRGKAKDEIIKYVHFPQKRYVKLPKKYEMEHTYLDGFARLNFSGLEKYSEYETNLKNLESAGYIKLKEEDEYIDDSYFKYMNVELTAKGKEDLGREDKNEYLIRTFDQDFGEITGIVEFKALNYAEVKYTIICNNISEFGKEVGEMIGEKINTESFTSSAEFRKYDDGWRIK